MELKLVIDGSDMRVRITPKHSADKKLLEFIAQMDIGRISVNREQYLGTNKNINFVDLRLEIEPETPDEEGRVAVKEVDHPIVND